MTSTESIPPDARHMAEQWLAVHDEVAPGLVEGLYLVGSLALDDWQPRSDIDVVVFTADPATESDAAALEAAHAIAVGRLADVRPGTNVDGPRLAWGDVSVPPMALHRPWTLDGAFHHDGECFELNPVTWHTLAARGVAVRGPEAPDLGVALDEHELRAFVRDNVDTYWRSVATSIAAAAADSQREEFDGGLLEWCVLGVARMLVTWETGDVVSKTEAGRRLLPRVPDAATLIERAVEDRRHPVEPGPDDRATVTATAELMSLVIDTITA